MLVDNVDRVAQDLAVLAGSRPCRTEAGAANACRLARRSVQRKRRRRGGGILAVLGLARNGILGRFVRRLVGWLRRRILGKRRRVLGSRACIYWKVILVA